MYTSKFPGNRKAVDLKGTLDNKYITVGDPYIDPNRKLPGRWKGPPVRCERIPQNAGNGLFGYNNKPYSHASEPYTETRRYAKGNKQPTGFAFSSHDAPKRDEFAATIRTEQYRETLKREARLLDSQRDIEAEKTLVEKFKSKTKEFAPGLTECEYLYDIGRTQSTPFNPKQLSDKFYQPPATKDLNPRKGSLRMGPYVTSSSNYGVGTWESKVTPPEFGTKSPIQHFNDKSHLTVAGF